VTKTAALGIDIAKMKFDVALQMDPVEAREQFSNNAQGFRQLARWVEKQRVGRVHACLEATGRYGDALALFLHEAGHQVSVVNPVRIKRYGESQLRRNKTDRMDAWLLMDFCARQQPKLWTPPTLARRALQAQERQLTALQSMRQQEVNRLVDTPPSIVVQEMLQAHIRFLDEQIAQLERQIQDHIDQHPDLKQKQLLLDSIPGIGKRTAARLLAEIPDFSQFDSARQLAAYVGLTPSHHESGDSVRGRPSLTRLGNSRLRAHLYFPAMVAIRWNPAVHAMSQRLTARGKSKMCIIVAAMRKLIHIAYGVLKSGRRFDPKLAIHDGKNT
jgi:transposase